MAVIQGAEFHSLTRPAGAGDRFVRVLRVNNVLHFRSGARAAETTTTSTTHPTIQQAANAYQHRLTMTNGGGMALVYAGPAFEVPASPDRLDAEAMFLDRWAASVAHDIAPTGTPRTSWALFYGLASERTRDTGASAALGALALAPHATEASTRTAPRRRADRIVGQVVALPKLQVAQSCWCSTDVTGLHTAGTLLGPVDEACPHGTPACEICNQRMAELILYLCRGIDLSGRAMDARARVIATANRLVRSSLARSGL